MVEEIVDMRGADRSIQSLAAGGLGAQSPRSCCHVSLHNVTKLIYSNFIGTI